MSEIDLSDEIVRNVARLPHEQVTCRRVGPNHYRCNWWAPQSKAGYDNPAMAGMLVTTNRVCRSRFMRVIKSGDQLSMTIICADGEPGEAPERK